MSDTKNKALDFEEIEGKIPQDQEKRSKSKNIKISPIVRVKRSIPHSDIKPIGSKKKVTLSNDGTVEKLMNELEKEQPNITNIRLLRKHIQPFITAEIENKTLQDLVNQALDLEKKG